MITICAATYIVLVQEKILKYQDSDQELLFVNLSIPIAIVLMSCSIQVGYTAIF